MLYCHLLGKKKNCSNKSEMATERVARPRAGGSNLPTHTRRLASRPL